MLRDFLRIEKGDFVSFVGGGGKTSLMLALAKELRQEFRVAVTTTTRMGADELPPWLDRIETGTSQSPAKLRKAVETCRFPVAIYGRIQNDKVMGIKPELVKSIAGKTDIILIEADGARRLPVKVPKPTEPVIPKKTTKVVVVYGYDGLDKPLSPGTCYNIEAMEQIGGIEEGMTLRPPVLRRLFLEGGYIKASRGKTVYAVINKADAGIDKAEKFARELYYDGIGGVAIASVKHGWVREVNNAGRRIAGIILAAGEGKRFGGNKMLASVNGVKIIERVISGASSPEISPLLLVLGSESSRILSRLDKKSIRRVHPLINADFKAGMSTSIKKGLESAEDYGAVMLFLGDMPYITKDTTERIIRAYRDSCAWACRAAAEGMPGHPVIIGMELFAELERIAGDEGARAVLDRHADRVLLVEADPATQKDVDTESDLEH